MLNSATKTANSFSLRYAEFLKFMISSPKIIITSKTKNYYFNIKNQEFPLS